MASDILGDYKLEFASMLGSGSYGHIIKGHHLETKQLVAVKRIEVDKEDVDRKKYLDIEVPALRKIPPHPNIVQMHHHQFQDGFLCIVMDFCDQGHVEKYMKKNELALEQVVSFISEIVDAVEFMHTLQQPVIHSNLKPETIFLSSVNGRLISKVGDFGTARIFNKDSKSMGTVMGTCWYLSPELWAGFSDGNATYDEGVDIFALGLIIHAMLEHKPKQDLDPITGKQISYHVSFFSLYFHCFYCIHFLMVSLFWKQVNTFTLELMHRTLQ